MKMIQPFILAVVVAFALSACAAKQQFALTDVTHEYRLRLSPTFDEPVELLLQHDTTGKTVMSVFSYSGMGGYTPRRKDKPKVFIITDEQWKSFSTAFHQYEPWITPELKPDQLTLDGCGITLEMREGRRQRKIYRWSPWAFKSEAQFVEAINEIVKLCPQKDVRESWLMK